MASTDKRMARPFEGKIALITGSSRGIGEAIARYCAARGAHIIINYVSDASAPRAAQLALDLHNQHAVHAVAVQGDVGDEGGATRVLEGAKTYFQEENGIPLLLHILVNNAGIARNAPLPAIDHADVAETFRVNVQAPIRVLQAALPYLPHDRSGRVVNLSSVSAAAGFVGQTVYAASKAALEAMTRVWARELAERATVNAVTPGPVEGPMYASNSPDFLRDIRGLIERTPLMKPRPGVDPDDVVQAATAHPEVTGGGRPAYTAEVAGIVGMLCLPEAGWCTGQVVSANGGMFM